MNPTDASAVLRAAAKTLRTLAEGTSPIPWFAANASDADCRWVAAMSPALAEPLATWLEDSAGTLERRYVDTFHPAWQETCVVDAVTSRNFGNALQLARVILAANDTTRST